MAEKKKGTTSGGTARKGAKSTAVAMEGARADKNVRPTNRADKNVRRTREASGTPAARAEAKGKRQLFAPVVAPTRVDYPQLEEGVQRWWDEHDILNRYLHRNDGSEKRWSFIDGPMTANNPMGVHHAWGRTYKDLWQRFNTMRGYRQRYQNGWDCQGLHVEVEVEKDLGFRNKHDIEAYGVGAFVEKCKERVLHFADVATHQSIRLGEWMDWSDSYYTMSNENNYTIWGFLKKCWQEGWIYKGHDVMPWCPRCGTGISDMEINEGRKKVTHTSVYVRFPLVGRLHEYLLVWTTTPWTLPANVAAAVNPALTYAKVEQDGNVYYLSSDVVPKLKKLRGREHGEAKVVATLPGSELLGWRYTGPYDELPAWNNTHTEHRVVAWDEVSAAEGTGIVHIAPGCGREDYGLAKEDDLAILAPVDENGVYVDGYDWLTGMQVADVARPIFDDLKEKRLFYQTESYEHVYPHCWRCKTELIFRLVEEWFIAMGSLDAPGDNPRKRLVRIVEDPAMTWIPGFGRERELDWLRNMEDWMISKKRYWGLALPIFVCPKCDAFEVIGSEDELRERAVAGWEEFAGHTPHRPWVDAVKIRCAACGEVASRIPDVGNPWLDAGIVPFSTLHYRHNRAYWRDWFPADFITESFPGQFRNWFYSLLVMAAVLEDTAPFKTVLGHATLIDEFGEEFHKSKGNSIPFDEAAAVVGADTMRWLYAGAAPEQNLRFPRIPTESEAAELRAVGQPPRLNEKWMEARAALDKLWNVYSFFVTYANIDDFDPTTRALPVSERTDLDRWVLSELQETMLMVEAGLVTFNAQRGAGAISAFVENLSNWYVRRSRRRFWKSEEDADKVAAYLTLYECLVTLAKLLAPFTPFLAESLYQNLVRSVDMAAPESVHLCDWPVADSALISPQLRDETALVLRLVNLGRAAREKAQIRVRQPLAVLYARVHTDAERESLTRLGEQVLEELNVKRLELLPLESDMLRYTLQPRMHVLGPKHGKLLPKVLAALRSGDMQAKARTLADTGRLPLDVEGQEVVLTPDEVEVEASAQEGYTATEERGYVVALDTTITPALLAEGLARDLTRLVQDVRKRAGLAVEDTIDTWLLTDAELAEVARTHSAYIKDETLTRELTVTALDANGQTGVSVPPAEGYTEVVPAAKLGGHEVVVTVRKR
ncbi:MAG: Isoleucyl-tRNA synthetase [Ktedonobacterales bacterium]|nr:MAG: Isoleucyl-tRNA synthetase [Ktedonobacterales bacterium]